MDATITVRRRGFQRGLIVAALAGGAFVVAHAQTPASLQRQPTFRTATDTVEVDVSVRDASGQPIRGLTKAHFTIPGQTITAFEEVSREIAADAERRALTRLPRDVSDNRTTHEASLVVIVMDDQVPLKERAKAGAVARQIVDQLGPGVRVGLLWTSGRPGVELTEDRTRLLAAIDRAQPGSVARVVRAASVVTGTCNFGVFEQAARLLAPLEAQRKVLLAVSPYCGADIKGAVDSMAPRPDNPMEVAAVQMVDVMRRANVAFFGVDPRGAAGFSFTHFPAPNIMGQLADAITTPQFDEGRPPMSVAASPVKFGWTLRMFDPVFHSQENLQSVAKATGGLSVTNTDDIAGGVARLVDDFDHYYLLGFSPPVSERKGFHKIQVLVDRPGAVVRARSGYEIDGVAARSGSLAALPEISGVLPSANVPLRLLAAPFASGSGAPRELVAIEVEAPRAALAVDGGSLADDVTVTIVAVRTDQSRVEKAFRFDRHVAIESASAGSGGTVRYQIVRAIELPAGAYQFRVSLKSARLAQTGSVYLSTDVPDYAQSSFELGGPLLAYADPQRPAANATLLDPGLPEVAPIFDRVLERGASVRVMCPVWRRPNGAQPAIARIELIDEHGTAVISTPAPISYGASPGVDAVVSLADAPPGAYRLRITAGAGGSTTSREVGVAIK